MPADTLVWIYIQTWINVNVDRGAHRVAHSVTRQTADSTVLEVEAAEGRGEGVENEESEQAADELELRVRPAKAAAHLARGALQPLCRVQQRAWGEREQSR